MKIEDNRRKNQLFGDIEIGTVFKDMSNDIFIKTIENSNGDNAVNLSKNLIAEFGVKYGPIIILNAKVVIE